MYGKNELKSDARVGEKRVYIVGSKGIPAKYGGFETFVDELVARRKDPNIKYYVACMGDGGRTDYNGATCFYIKVPPIGPAKAIWYDLRALRRVTKMANGRCNDGDVVYVLACRVGPFFRYFVKKMHRMGLRVLVNPDGHEWKRAKWGFWTRRYWKISEKLMVKNADLLVCDSSNIEKYIRSEYRQYHPETVFIAYGADETRSPLGDESSELTEWYKKFGLSRGEYYAVIGRFVPENNLEIIIREFMSSKTDRDLVIVTNVEKNKFYTKLKRSTGFDGDKRIKFVGTVYDKNLIKKVREEAFAYIHGHSVGGTNPSLLESLASTRLNILYDCSFNREVAKDGAVYFGNIAGDLAKKIDTVERMTGGQVANMEKKAKKRIQLEYSWGKIVGEYERLWRME